MRGGYSFKDSPFLHVANDFLHAHYPRVANLSLGKLCQPGIINPGIGANAAPMALLACQKLSCLVYERSHAK